MPPIKLHLVKIFLVASILVTCLAAVMSWVNYTYYRESAKEIDDAHAIMLKTTEVLSLMKDGETGMRGYILTQDSNYLTPFHLFESQIGNYRTYLLDHLESNKILERDFAKIMQLISAKESILRSTIEINDKQGTLAAMQLIKTNRGKVIMDSLRVEVAKMLEKEKIILRDSSRNYEDKLKLINAIRYGIQVFVIIISLTALLVLIKRDRQNSKLIEQLNNANYSLEQKVFERTRELNDLNLELQMQNKEILSKKEEIDIKNEELVKLNADKNRFLGIATHDMKSPINRIKGFVNIIKASPNSTVISQNEYLDMILSSLSSMQKLISKLLDINRIEEGVQEVNFVRFDLVGFAQKCLQSFDAQAHAKQISLVFGSDVQNLEVQSDKDILTQILENLISNALKFSEKGKEVRLNIQSRPFVAKIIVQDQGPGISENEMSLLFGKFQKLSNRPTDGESSSGLGLSIVKELTESLKGKIYCESVLGQGSAFIVEIPVDAV